MALQATSDGEGNRAVSPVIGVILMVAITVILAAVIGAFVLEIGDQQETAPNTSFESEQETIFLKSFVGATGDEETTNTTQVHLSHAGGDVISVSNVRVSVNGNTSVWGLHKTHEETGYTTQVAPQPAVWEEWGTNEPVTFESGESWNALAFCGAVCREDSTKRWPSMENIPVQSTHIYPHDFWEYNGEEKVELSYDDDPKNAPGWGACPSTSLAGCKWYHLGWGDLVESEDTVRVVWTAESGGKTQTLYKYAVQ